MAEKRRRRDLPEVEGAPVERGVGPAREETHSPPALHTSQQALESLPQPHESTAGGNLDDRGRADLFRLCEDAIGNLGMAFWAAGKALELVRDLDLYQDDYPTFEAYLIDRWDMSTSQAYRLMQGWRLAEHMLQRSSPIGDKIKFNNAQVQELLPIADRHGDEAAWTVYEAVVEAAEANETRVTAAVLKGAVKILPEDDDFDPDKAAEQIRAYLAGQTVPPKPPSPSPAELWTTESTRARSALRRIRRDTVRAAAAQNPDEAREFITELRDLADEIDKQLNNNL
jgi:hypothetical protein